MAVDPLTGAVAGWLTNQLGGAGQRGLRRLLQGDRQQNALRRLVRDAVERASDQLADGRERDILREALLVEAPGLPGASMPAEPGLRGAILRMVTPRLEPMAELGYAFSPDEVTDALVAEVEAAIQSDGARAGPLAPLAEWLRHQRVAVAGERSAQATEESLSVQREILNLLSSGSGREEPHGGLPGESRYFTGRAGPMAELSRRVEAHDPAGPVVAVHSVDGMPGVGKTAFAVHAGHVFADRYPDGAMFVDLYGFTPSMSPLPASEALEELLRQAGVSGDQIPAGLAGRRAMWRSVMARRRALIVLDNARDGDHVTPLLPEAAGCLVLITSRTKLYDIDAEPLTLDILPEEDASDLFIRLVGAQRCPDREVVKRIVRACGRLPLAIRLIAGRMRHFDDSPDEIIEDLARLSMEQTIQRSFALSYAALPADAQRAFRLIGFYPGRTVTAGTMAAICDVTASEGRQLLHRLAEHNLLERIGIVEPVGGTRYGLHDLVRSYAQERAAEEPAGTVPAVLNRLARFYLPLLRDTGVVFCSSPEMPADKTRPAMEVVEARDWLVAERENLKACAAAPADPPAGFLVALGLLWVHIGAFDEAEACYRTAANKAGVTDRDRVYATRGLAEVSRLTGHNDVARERFQRTLGEARAAVFPKVEAWALRGLAVMDVKAGRWESAKDGFERALSLFREHGDEWGETAAHTGLALVARQAGDHQTARDHHRQTMEIAERVHFDSATADALSGLAHLDHAEGRYEAAREELERALRIHEETGVDLGQAQVLHQLGEVSAASGDIDLARRHWEEALVIYERLGHVEAQTVQEHLTQLG